MNVLRTFLTRRHRWIPPIEWWRRWFFPRSIRLTPEGRGFLLLTLAVGIAAVNTGNNLFYLLLAMMLSLIVMSGILSEQCFRDFQVKRWIPPHVFADDVSRVRLTLTNRKRLMPSFSMHIAEIIDGREFHVEGARFHLAPGATAIRSYAVSFPSRGRHRISGYRLFTTFPFGLFIKSGVFSDPGEVIVYPRRQELPKGLLQDFAVIGTGREVNRAGAGSAMHNLREHVAGDDSRSIHWKTSARQGRLMSKEYEAEDNRRMTILLNNRRNSRSHATDEPFEEAIRLTAAVARHFLDRRVGVRLVMLDHTVAFDTGRPHLYRILNALALAEPCFHEGGRHTTQLLHDMAMRRQQGELCVLITPWEDPVFVSAHASFTRMLRPEASDVQRARDVA